MRLDVESLLATNVLGWIPRPSLSSAAPGVAQLEMAWRSQCARLLESLSEWR